MITSLPQVLQANPQELWSLTAPLGAILSGEMAEEGVKARLCLAGVTFLRDVWGRKTANGFICGVRGSGEIPALYCFCI